MDREEANYARTTAVDALLSFQRASALLRELEDAPTSAHNSLRRGSDSNGPSSSSAYRWAGAARRGSDRLMRRVLALAFGAGPDDGLSPAQRQVKRRVGALEAIIDGVGSARASGDGGAADGGSVLDQAIRLGPWLEGSVCEASKMLKHAAELADGRTDRAFERERRKMLDAPGAGGSSASRNGFGGLSLSEGVQLSRVSYDLRYHDVVGAVMCEEARRTTAGSRRRRGT